MLNEMSARMRDLFGHLRHEPTEKRVRALAGGQVVVDSTRAVLVWEPRRISPSFAVPEADIRAPLSPAAAAPADAPAVLHPGVPFAVHSAPGSPVSVGDLAGAGFRPDDPDLAGLVVLDFNAFDTWLEEDEELFSHPRDPFHRIDVRRSSRRVRIERDGEVLAESTRARLLFETGIHVRFYLPRQDVHVELTPSTKRSSCPYKGHASYYAGDLCWSYEDPLPDAAPIAGLIAFWDERVDVLVDGVVRARPAGPVAQAMRDEFGL